MMSRILVKGVFYALGSILRTCYNGCMSERHSRASQIRWAKVLPEERRRVMSRIASIRHKKMGLLEKREMIAKMTRGRVNKARALEDNLKKHDAKTVD